MHNNVDATVTDDQDAYRAIEQALVATDRGRWFLSEHSRQARRLDAQAIEATLADLKASLREPPATLTRVCRDLESLHDRIVEVEQVLLARQSQSASALALTHTPEQQDADRGLPVAAIATVLDASEKLHDCAWNLSADEHNEDAYRDMARYAASIQALAQYHAAHSVQVRACTAALTEVRHVIAKMALALIDELSDGDTAGDATVAAAAALKSLENASAASPVDPVVQPNVASQAASAAGAAPATRIAVPLPPQRGASTPAAIVTSAQGADGVNGAATNGELAPSVMPALSGAA
ncbi:MAG: hypothetical protein AAFR04_02270 [Pseudomonadota bacterium]